MNIESGFDKRTTEGKRNFATGALLDFAYKDNIDIEFQGQEFPSQLDFFNISIPQDGTWRIDEVTNNEERVDALRITVLDSQKRIFDVHEVSIPVDSQFDKYIKGK